MTPTGRRQGQDEKKTKGIPVHAEKPGAGNMASGSADGTPTTRNDQV